MDVISLLLSKNHCLKRLLDLSAGFIAAADSGDFGRLREFHAKRERFFKALSLYDRKLASEIAALPLEKRTEELIDRVKAGMEEQSRLTQAIIGVDNRIMTRIEEEKARIQQDLAATRKSQSLVARFKSGWIPGSGEELDRTL